MTVKIKQIAEEIAMDEQGQEYIITQEGRGANEKIWIRKIGGSELDAFLIRFSSHPKKPTAIHELSLYNEVICSKLCDKLNLYHVPYKMCEYTDIDQKVHTAVICPNYKESTKHRETNGKTLLENYQGSFYDNNFGQIPELPINTVYTYLELIKSRYESRRMIMSEETKNRLLEEMLTLALFDFSTCQIDRHWKNIGWLNNNFFDDNKFRIWLLPIYDNECSFLLDEATPNDIEKMVGLIHNPKKKHNFVEMINRKKYNSPYLGIKTPLVRLKDGSDSFLVPCSDTNNMSNAMIAAKELAEEICNRPNLETIYNKIANFDINKFLDEITFIPESQAQVKEIYSFVWNTRVGLLKDAMEKRKQEITGEQNNDKSLS